MPQKKAPHKSQSSKSSKHSSSKTSTAKRPCAKASPPTNTTMASARAKQPSTKTAPSGAASATKAKAATKVVAHVDVGWGNKLFIRGEGPGLNWNQGIEMKNTGPNQWEWTTNAQSGTIELKFLINDQQWNEGQNMQVTRGSTAVAEPTFN